MKKLVSLIVAILAMVAILFGVKNMLQAKESTEEVETSSEQQQLFLFNWGNYIDPELIKEFEAETGIQVVYETFDSNDAMEAKLKQGGTRYDIVFPSESSITKLVNQNLLQKLDHSKIKGLENISPFLLNSPVDKGNQYTIPYFWGTVGIMVNTKYIDPESIQTWNDLWKEDFKNKVLVLDGNREALGMALQSLGYSLNSKNEDELKAAEQKLKELKPNVRAVLNEEIKTMMKLEEAPIGMGYSGDAAAVAEENPNVQYILPKDGSAVWTDNFAIAHTAVNIDGAYAFINFMLRPENAARNAEYVGYSTPNEKAKELMDPEVTSDETYYPSEEIINSLEHYEYLGNDWIQKYNEAFLDFKMEL
ncbi:spermidine/putrescine ABC transporter substrate-binding protein [Granulicatella sp. 20925_1_28]|jgi:spermidine/putrescine-binding periplasmic protein potD|uniref:ABC transporter substrate-binding protein n=1 Tax=Granulicatella sp. 20925_1_28 TaxID=3003686 RepID=UPI000660862F